MILLIALLFSKNLIGRLHTRAPHVERRRALKRPPFVAMTTATPTNLGRPAAFSSLQVERFINIILESTFVNFYLSLDEALTCLINLLL
jgi:hypothetical protein